MRQIGRTTALGILVVAALASECEWGKAGQQVVAGVNAPPRRKYVIVDVKCKLTNAQLFLAALGQPSR